MLDVRPVAYVTPIAEQEFASLTPLIRIVSAGDEDATLTGLVRIYRISTGLLIYSSELTITEIVNGTTIDVAALTPWSPPAPADDDYQIVVNTTATSHPPAEWHQQTASLGAYTFDIKPVGMGPAPAAHAPTHENGGSDPIEVETLPTSELDDTLRLAPDGAGGLAWQPAGSCAGFEELANKGIAGGYCGLPDPLDATLPLRADGTAARPVGTYDSFDFERTLSVSPTAGPWSGTLVSSGTTTSIAGTANHPGISTLNSSTSANSGVSWKTAPNAYILAGYETTELIFRPQSLAGTTIRFGFHDSASSSDAVDGAYIEMAQVGGVDGVIVGKTASNSTRSTTGTNYTLVTNTWYKLRIVVNSNASRVDFYLYSEAGALLWTDNLTTNIPTAAGRETGNGIVATNSGTTALTLVDLDSIIVILPRTLTR